MLEQGCTTVDTRTSREEKLNYRVMSCLRSYVNWVPDLEPVLKALKAPNTPSRLVIIICRQRMMVTNNVSGYNEGNLDSRSSSRLFQLQDHREDHDKA